MSEREQFMATIRQMWINIGRSEKTWNAAHDWDELFRAANGKADAAVWAFEECLEVRVMSHRCQQPQAHPARCGCEQMQQRLLPLAFILPHPPRHEGFLQPGREVPGYTIEQMKEYGAQCVAAFIEQNKVNP